MSLHSAVDRGDRNLVERQLKYGADPNLSNAEGSTPLHIIGQKPHIRIFDNVTMEIFLKMCKKVQRPLQIDAKDNKGRIPLQLAVANIMPDVVDLLLTNGADLSSFVFPAEIHFVEFIMKNKGQSRESKLRVISGAVACVERLEKGGYDLDQSDALTIMRFLSNHGMFRYSTKIEECWFDDDVFARHAKRIMIIPSMSLYDLARLPPKTLKKQLTLVDFWRYLHNRCQPTRIIGKGFESLLASYEIFELEDIGASIAYVCETVTREFFRPLAVDCFYDLINGRLPIECCARIIDDSLTNKDLCSICFAVSNKARKMRSQ